MIDRQELGRLFLIIQSSVLSIYSWLWSKQGVVILISHCFLILLAWKFYYHGICFDLKMIHPKLFIFLLWIPIRLAGWIWNPECSQSWCWGDPLEGDGISSFDDWSGSYRYSTRVFYTCNEGVGFDLYDNNYNAPAKIYAQCGQQCLEGTFPWGHQRAGQGNGRCKYNQGPCYPDWLYSFTPEWGSLPDCSIGEEEMIQ